MQIIADRAVCIIVFLHCILFAYIGLVSVLFETLLSSIGKTILRIHWLQICIQMLMIK